MKSLSEQLLEHLSSISEEQLQEEWKEIEALGLEGPNAVEYARFIQLHNPNCGEVLPKIIIPPQFFTGNLDIITQNP